MRRLHLTACRRQIASNLTPKSNLGDLRSSGVCSTKYCTMAFCDSHEGHFDSSASQLDQAHEKFGAEQGGAPDRNNKTARR
ncbi:uncharacterized protein MYCFIDRAFT_211031 [Pseudocercospora fijiensis CIRAD86]|uniref:Uncharacterized protein n=1 Tax=Pseudocercospora fijiensis (strain CIRAD86) TaxID=383855 RepID=M3B6R9_PSEFD|nr:uncharacterized protein MYCFIDRAFT_211031 [Pseudocercospora fijiensis CIRAD86]EME85042.1 hypothetical protein MYCFIDRAFT_211031 [Pseudocercospora fijiensis CIRAD86]